MTDNGGKVSRMRYDERGNLTKTIDALGNTTDVTYNIADQPVESLLPATAQHGSGRTKSQVTYAYVGGPTTSTRLFDEGGLQVQQSSVTYGPEGETLSVSGDTEPATTTYDALYRTKTIKDGNDNVTSYVYDSVGRLYQIRYPGAGTGVGSANTITFPSYNDDDQVLQRVDGRGRVTNYSYNDVEGALTGVSYVSSPGENVTYAYDAFGLPQSVSDASGTRTYTYNSVDVLTQVGTRFKKADGTLLSAKNIAYSYNADGSRASMTTPAGTFTYGYDGGGRWTGLQDHAGNQSTWNYDDLHRLTKQTRQNGVWTGYGYNALSQLTVTGTLGAGGNLLSAYGHASDANYKLRYDGRGNLTREAAGYDMYSSSRFFAGIANYSYDNKSQLTSESSTRYSTYNHTFAYDSAGNPTTWKGQSRTFNALNQETTLNASGQTQFAYDGNGNPTTYKGNTLVFDEENHLTSYTKPDGTTPLRAVYREDGKRAWKQVASGNRFLFLYDGDQIVCGFNANGDLSRINVWGAHGLIGRQSGTNMGTMVYDYVWDNRGNISQVLNPNGAVAYNFRVSAWGEVASDVPAGSANDPYRCLGGELGNYVDVETGLVLCGQRYYDPSGGRWLNRDPISYDGGMNVYAYVNNNPVNKVDPYGLSGYSRSECWELLQRIIKNAGLLSKEIAKYDPVEDGKGGFPIAASKGGGYTKPGGHYEKILNFKRGLLKDIARYWEKCGGKNRKGPRIPAWIPKLAHQPVRVPVFVPNLSPAQRLSLHIPGSYEAWNTAGNVAMGIGITAGAGWGFLVSGGTQGATSGRATQAVIIAGRAAMAF